MSETSHVGPIIFTEYIPQNQLKLEGEVVTFRENDRTTGDTWWRESRTGPKKGDVRVELIDAVCPHGTGQGLEPYVDKSGFDSVHHWQQAIRAVNGGMPKEGWLYRVTLLEGGDA